MDNSLTNMGHAINFMAKAEWRENIGLTLDKCQILVQDLSITCPTTKLWQGLDMDKFLTNIGQALDKCQKFVQYLSITCHTTHSIPAPKMGTTFEMSLVFLFMEEGDRLSSVVIMPRELSFLIRPSVMRSWWCSMWLYKGFLLCQAMFPFPWWAFLNILWPALRFNWWRATVFHFGAK